MVNINSITCNTSTLCFKYCVIMSPTFGITSLCGPASELTTELDLTISPQLTSYSTFGSMSCLKPTCVTVPG